MESPDNGFVTRIDLARLLAVDPLSKEARQLPFHAQDGLMFAVILDQERISVAELAAQLTAEGWRAMSDRARKHEEAFDYVPHTSWTPQRVYRRLTRALRELKLREWRCLYCLEPIPRGPFATGRPADYCQAHADAAARRHLHLSKRNLRKRRRAECQRRLEL